MQDQDCVRFLQATLPRLGLKWWGYRKVRRTVCKRIGRRLRELGLSDLAAYRRLLDQSLDERARLDAFCRIPISRFYRDRAVFDTLGYTVLPDLAECTLMDGTREIRCWSAGCASGEEVYTLRLIWDLTLQTRYPDVRLMLLGTDADRVMLKRATVACYPPSSLKDAPPDWPTRAFSRDNETLCLRPEYRRDTRFRCEDIRQKQPAGPFHLVLCRNLAFTYFADDLQRPIAAAIEHCLLPGGYLVLGMHEQLPADAGVFSPAQAPLPIWRRAAKAGEDPA